MAGASAVTEWRGLSWATRLYIYGVTATGLLAILWSLPVALRRDVPLLLTLAILSLVASVAKVSLPIPRSVSTLTVCYVVDFTTLLLLGRAPATLTAALGAWSQCTFRRRQSTPSYQTWFSVGALALTAQLAGLTYSWTSGGVLSASGGMNHVAYPSGLLGSPALVEAVIAAAVVFFVANSVLVAIAVALATSQSALDVWMRNYLWSWPGHLLGFSLAVGAAAGIGRSRMWLVPFALVSLALTYENFKAYVARFTESVTDPLTELSNSRHLLAHVPHELARSARHGESLAMMIIDLDGFKSINDTYGHRVGDSVLREVARCLKQSTRSYDTCARYGGDEFIAVLPGCGLEDAEHKAEALRDAVSALACQPKGGIVVPIRVSVGLAVYPDDGDTFDELLGAADDRMFDDKRAHSSRPRTRVTGDTLIGASSAPSPPLAFPLPRERASELEKMAAIGQLASGMAHDFNNALTAIIGYSQLLAEQVGPETSMARDLKELANAAQHAAELTHDLVTLSSEERAAEPDQLKLCASRVAEPRS
jgi:diguanylate cyclase (GGDEF)-like protein